MNKGTRLPIFHLSGKTPSCKEHLKMIQCGLATTLETFLRILLLIRSGPEALFGSRFSITSLASSSVISMLSKVASVSSVNGGSYACESSSEDTDAK